MCRCVLYKLKKELPNHRFYTSCLFLNHFGLEIAPQSQIDYAHLWI